MKKKVVLAFSGGLDTSFCVKYLSVDKGMDVHTAIVQTGGFSDQELLDIEKKANVLGTSSHATLIETDSYYNNCIKYLIFGNVLRYNTYPLSVSAERVFQAIAIAKYAKKIGADAIAHGSTGAGNDQVRFDMVFQIIAPEMEVITPIRDNKLSREAEIEYLAKYGFEKEWATAKYSINKGLWGTSVGGAETLTSDQALPESAYPTQVTKEDESTLELSFEKGELTAVNGEVMSSVEAIKKVEELAGPYGVGRDIHVGDTIIGIKGRVGFEAAAPLVIVKAHHALEKHTLTKWQLHWKENLSSWYGMMVHEGQFLDPALRNIEKFLGDTQEYVTGKVFIALAPYRFSVNGISSDHDLMSSKFGAYGEMNNTWTGQDVRGFAKILSNQTTIFHQVNEQELISEEK